MNIKKLIVSTLIAGASVSSAFATQTFHSIGGEGFIQHNTPSEVSREQVKNELEKAQQYAIGNNREMPISGDISYIDPKHSYAIKNGGIVHTDKISHSATKSSQKYVWDSVNKNNIYIN